MTSSFMKRDAPLVGRGMRCRGRQDQHIFRIEELPDGRAKFKQEDGLNGKKRNFLFRMVEAQIGKAYDKFNRELKARVESLYPRS